MLLQDSIAKIPLIVYVSGFLSTFLSKPLNKCYGRKVIRWSKRTIVFLEQG